MLSDSVRAVRGRVDAWIARWRNEQDRPKDWSAAERVSQEEAERYVLNLLRATEVQERSAFQVAWQAAFAAPLTALEIWENRHFVALQQAGGLPRALSRMFGVYLLGRILVNRFRFEDAWVDRINPGMRGEERRLALARSIRLKALWAFKRLAEHGVSMDGAALATLLGKLTARAFMLALDEALRRGEALQGPIPIIGLANAHLACDGFLIKFRGRPVRATSQKADVLRFAVFEQGDVRRINQHARSVASQLQVGIKAATSGSLTLVANPTMLSFSGPVIWTADDAHRAHPMATIQEKLTAR